LVVAGGVVIKLLPLLGQKLDNWVLSAQKAEARRNPIEQAQNRYLQRAEQLRLTKQALATIGGQIGAQRTRLKDRQKADPHHDLTDQFNALQRMEQGYERLKIDYQTACVALEKFHKEIERKKFDWESAGMLRTIDASMNPQDAESLKQDMLTDEAFRSVDQEFNAAFAALDVQTVNLNENKKLDYGSGVVLDLKAVEIPTSEEQKLLRKAK
jgi:hypothetical protein